MGSNYRKRTFVVTFTITSVSELCSVFISFSTLCNAYDLKKDFKTPCCTKSSVTDILSTVSSFRLLVCFFKPILLEINNLPHTCVPLNRRTHIFQVFGLSGVA